jgi:hypothetical protein
LLVENAVKLFITDIPAKKLYISSKKLGFFTIQELNESIKKSFFDLVNKKIIKKLQKILIIFMKELIS